MFPVEHIHSFASSCILHSPSLWKPIGKPKSRLLLSWHHCCRNILPCQHSRPSQPPQHREHRPTREAPTDTRNSQPTLAPRWPPNVGRGKPPSSTLECKAGNYPFLFISSRDYGCSRGQRKTGVTVADTGKRDEFGMEDMDDFFSPVKTGLTPAPPPKPVPSQLSQFTNANQTQNQSLTEGTMDVEQSMSLCLSLRWAIGKF